MQHSQKYVLFCSEGPRSRYYGRTAALRLIVQPCDDYFFFVFPSNGAPVEWNRQGKNRSTRRKTCPSVTLSTTNPTWTNPGSNPSLRGEREICFYSYILIYLFVRASLYTTLHSNCIINLRFRIEIFLRGLQKLWHSFPTLRPLTAFD